MKKTTNTIKAIFLGAAVWLSACQQSGEEKHYIKTDGPEVVSFRALQFDLDDVKLLDGPFLEATKRNEKILLNYEPDRFLAHFREQAGLEPKAEHYGGWEGESLTGHSLGHYLSACSMMYKTTGNEEFLRRVNYIVDELYEVQKADGDGYIGAFENGKKIFEEEIAKGEIRSAGFDLNGIWAPIYTQHKVMAGLMDAYHLCGNEKALEIEKNFADWLGTIVKDLSHEEIQKMLHCEYGGINEAYVELYAVTGEEKYLELSRVFHDDAVLGALSKGIDILPGHHANTQIPKVIGLARRYELTGDTVDRKTAEFFWERVVNHHSYVTGGNGDHEYFGPPDTLSNRLSSNTTETCNVYNMLKLSNHLFKWEGNARVADFYERALFNHILSSQHPKTGHVIYNLSLEMGGHKHYQNPHGFTCCVGTGMENHSKYPRNIYFYNDKELFVSQFIASELYWEEKSLKMTQKTDYPDEQNTSFTFECEQPVELTLRIRYPYWAKEGMTVKVNGKNVSFTNEPQSFLAINRTWESGDKVEVSFPFSLRLEPMPDNKDRVALMHGPLVLAGQLGPEDDPDATDPLYVPVLMVEDRNPEAWTSPVPDEPNTFKTEDVGRPRDIVFKPFFETHDWRYSVYFDIFNEEKWKSFQEEYSAKQEAKKELEARTIDFFQPGEMQPERDHNFKSKDSWVHEYRRRKYREADRGGWMSFEMDVNESHPVQLAVEYWGGYQGSRTFDILVNGEIIVTENISNARPGEFYTEVYDIPDAIDLSNGTITVKFDPKDNHRAGPIFGVRTLKGIE
ncbi:glycoside hydrolase family 127 protein [Anaerophaga thermohalophila]|uniref:glycoside hydrolase family 127 protein n=1 Tax=Anaerophaga thermohalophila TaxID=177400 RepID=UPI0002F6F6F0|nr:glycoside hydrolase family 127 protein [Anaerophaga thermohalophila]